MSKIYKGWELLKEIAEGNIKEGTKMKCGDILGGLDEIVVYEGDTIWHRENYEELHVSLLIDYTFEIIEEPKEIDIQAIEEIYKSESKSVGKDIEKCWTGRNLDLYFADKINELIQALKQLDNKIKECK